MSGPSNVFDLQTPDIQYTLKEDTLIIDHQLIKYSSDTDTFYKENINKTSTDR